MQIGQKSKSCAINDIHVYLSTTKLTTNLKVYFRSFIDENDYIINTNSAVIEVGSSTVCINIQAVDDRLIESLESIAVITDPRNNFDGVSPNSTAVTIMDNDGEKVNGTTLK